MKDIAISDSVVYIGADDHDIDLFESQYVVPNGISYNSYVILDEKTAVMDTADVRVTDKWFENLENALNGRKPDYLVVQHMEPDHAGNIRKLAEKYPDMKIVGNAKTFPMMKQFFDIDGLDEFGKFGALDTEEDWACEARRYYFNIVGKYGAQVQALLKKAAALDIKMILPLHGPILKENLGYYIDLYNTWSSYQPESKGVFVAFASIHGNTAKAAEKLAGMLAEKGAEKVVVTDLSRSDIAENVEDAFRYDRMILMSSSYDGGVFPVMEDFLMHLKAKSYQNRKVGIVENGSWAPTAGRVMKSYVEGFKNVSLCEPVVTIRSSLNEASEKALEELAAAIAE